MLTVFRYPRGCALWNR